MTKNKQLLYVLYQWRLVVTATSADSLQEKVVTIKEKWRSIPAIQTTQPGIGNNKKYIRSFNSEWYVKLMLMTNDKLPRWLSAGISPLAESGSLLARVVSITLIYVLIIHTQISREGYCFITPIWTENHCTIYTLRTD